MTMLHVRHFGFRSFVWAYYGVLMVAALVSVSYGSLLAYHQWRPPVVIHSISVLTPEVARGGEGRVYVQFTKLRDCPAEVLLTIQDSTGALHFAKGPRNWARVGSHEVRLPFPVPSSAALGLASHWRTISYQCYGSKTLEYVVRTKPQAFVVVEGWEK